MTSDDAPVRTGTAGTAPTAQATKPARPDLGGPDFLNMTGLTAARAVLDRVIEVTSNRDNQSSGQLADVRTGQGGQATPLHELVFLVPWPLRQRGATTVSRYKDDSLTWGAQKEADLHFSIDRKTAGTIWKRGEDLSRRKKSRVISQPAQSPDFNILDLSLILALHTLQQTRRMNTVTSIVDAVEGAYKELRWKTLVLTLMSVMAKCVEDEEGNQFQIPHIKKEKRRKAGKIFGRCHAARQHIAVAGWLGT
ncbi:unnamed protein product [Phytophthora fragariaefolia]|uniref:Unnamed protein product n=1 Tax=Phytophthora fragariaefolia TaxID=1490495 RepID=A0A9W6XSZ0_9STRA|nr:unnamed protein product [Phytophthora fragariaefolia]